LDCRWKIELQVKAVNAKIKILSLFEEPPSQREKGIERKNFDNVSQRARELTHLPIE